MVSVVHCFHGKNNIKNQYNGRSHKNNFARFVVTVNRLTWIIQTIKRVGSSKFTGIRLYKINTIIWSLIYFRVTCTRI